MGENTKIEWADHSANAWWGCVEYGPGCVNCYARTFSKRVGFQIWGKDAPRRYIKGFKPLIESLHKSAAKRGVTETVFVNDMSDFFEDYDGPVIDSTKHLAVWSGKEIKSSGFTQGQEEWNPNDESFSWVTLRSLRSMAFEIMDKFNENLIYMLLTKRPKNVIPMWPDYIALHDDDPDPAVHNGRSLRPRPHVWLGTSMSNQRDVDRNWYDLQKAAHLAGKTFISIEPLVEKVDLRRAWRDVRLPDWVIIGGESGPGHRPCNIDWIRSAVEQCRAAGVACFVKQLGSNAVQFDDGGISGNEIDDATYHTKHPKGGDMQEFPADLQVREFPNVY